MLAALGDVLRKHVRQSDIAARWGGEEFVVAYTNTDVVGARVAAERLRRAIEATAMYASKANGRNCLTVANEGELKSVA